jgi:hypothetical protein
MVSEALPAGNTFDKPGSSLRFADKAILGFLVLFFVVSFLEGYWLLHHNEMESRTDFAARLLKIYWPMDYTFRIPGYGMEKAVTLSVESINTCVSQWFNLLLIWAIVKRKAWRHPLQMILATYTAYGTVLYYYVAHLSGYKVMAEKTPMNLFLFYLINAPWLIFCIYMVYDSVRACTRALASQNPQHS